MDEVSVVDYHTAGEPFRIVTSVEIPGDSVADRRVTAQSSEAIDAVRQLLVNEPRGHADMYGGFVVPGDDDGADFGVVFWHKDGYSTACGHGTIALATWAVDTGLVQPGDVVIDVPSGRVTAANGVPISAYTGYTITPGTITSACCMSSPGFGM